MSGMKDVPSTERMVMCSQRWKLLKQNEKDAYQKRCEQVSEQLAEYMRNKNTLDCTYMNLSAKNVLITCEYNCVPNYLNLNSDLLRNVSSYLLLSFFMTFPFYFRKRKNMKLRWTDTCV